MNSCYSCMFRLSFTPREREIILPKLHTLGLDGNFSGACIEPWQIQSTLVRRYLDREVTGCSFYKQGYYRELLHTPCPSCKNGHLMINRPVNHYRPYLLIGCSNYPKCRFTVRQLQLKTNCRYCHQPLFLKADETLTCYCLQCKRRIEILLMARCWPTLFQENTVCSHQLSWEVCVVCQRSMAERVSLIELEMPDVAKLWLQGIGNNGEKPRSTCEPSLISQDINEDIVCGIDEDIYLYAEEDNWSYEETVNDYLEFTDDFRGCMGNELSTGWFYGE